MSRIVWFHPRQLLPPRGGGDHRTLGLIHGALGAGHEVLLVQPDDELTGGVPPAGLRTLALTKRRGVGGVLAKVLAADPLRAPRLTRGARATARRVIEDFEPDLGIVSEVMTWGMARALLPGVPWAYDAQNVEHELFASHLASASTPMARMTFRVDQRRVARAERRLLRGSSAVIAVSDADAAGLRKVDATHEPVIVPSSMMPPAVPCRPSGSGQVALFVGTLDFPPNIEAVDDLVLEVMPEVRRRSPEARLLVVGRRPSKQMRELFESRAWVEFWEDAPSMADAYARARLVMMPFKSGSGTKLKLYEAMAFGLPVVATPKGVAGVDVDGESGVLVADHAHDLAEAAVTLLEAPDEADRVGAAARRTFEDRLSWERAAYPQLGRVIEDLAPTRP